MKIKEIVLYICVFLVLCAGGIYIRHYEHQQLVDMVVNKLIEKGVIKEQQ